MTEGEASNSQEVQEVSPRAKRVEDAMDSAWQQPQNSEYWEIRKQLDKRLAWHGGGVVKHFIKTVDAASDTMIKDKFLRGIVKTLDKPIGVGLGYVAASVDIAWNVATWGLRRVLPIPKDIAKRAVLYGTYAVAGGAGVTGLAYEGFKAQKELFLNLMNPGRLLVKASKTEAYQKGLKATKSAGEAVFTGPEAAITMAKRRVDNIIGRMKKPNGPVTV